MTTEDEEGGTKEGWTRAGNETEIAVEGSWRRRRAFDTAAVVEVDNEEEEEKEMTGEKEKREWKN